MDDKDASFTKALEQLINCYSQENASNTPDFILARYIHGCLTAYNEAVTARAEWYGRYDSPGQIENFDGDPLGYSGGR